METPEDKKPGEDVAKAAIPAKPEAPVFITLKRKDRGDKKGQDKKFVKEQALALLTLNNTQWEMSTTEKAYTFNGEDFQKTK